MNTPGYFWNSSAHQILILFTNTNSKHNTNNVILPYSYNFVHKINYFLRIRFLDIEFLAQKNHLYTLKDFDTSIRLFSIKTLLYSPTKNI